MISEKETGFKSYKVCLRGTVENFTKGLFYSLFDEDYKSKNIVLLKAAFLTIYQAVHNTEGDGIWNILLSEFPNIRKKLDLDALAMEQYDPATKSLEEVYLASPGFHAISVYRLSHELYKLNCFIISRMMSEYIHGVTGIDIHPGATIGASFFIDHGTGIVIGETAVIKDRVKIFQGVTLGGIQVKKSMSATKRHPTIENDVVIYANATILGGDIVIGANSIIGANVWITQSVPENALVTYQSEIKITTRK